MIKKFKLFEKFGNSAKDDIIDQFGENYIEEYYNDNYNIDIEEIIEIWPNIIANHIDDDSFVRDFINDEISSFTIDDFSDYDYKQYIENNIDDEMESEIIKLYKENQGLDNNDIISKVNGKVSNITKSNKIIISITDDSGKINKYKIPNDYTIVVEDGDIVTNDMIIAKSEDIEYDDDMLNDLDESQLREIIENCNEEEEFLEEIINDRYEGYDAMDIIHEIYGNDINGRDLYRIVSAYLKDDDVIEEYKNNEDFEYKIEFILQSIEYDSTLYDYLIEKNEKNVILLARYFVDESFSPSFVNDYEFQNKYIEQKVEEHFEDLEPDEKEESEVIADALVFLNDNFILDELISKEYDDYMWKITSNKYNL